jgi:hypothetical protein
MPFEKGKSGNPGGRNKEHERLKKLALSYCPAAIKRLGELIASKDARTAVAASSAILDRGLGKPAQALEHSGMIATTHEEYLKQLDAGNDADGEGDPASVAG